MARTDRSDRADRTKAKAAISAADVATREAAKLAERMPRGRRRSRLTLAVVDADLARRAARERVGDAPRLAARTAARATARLQRAAAAGAPSHRDRSGRAGAERRSGGRRAAGAGAGAGLLTRMFARGVPTSVLAPGLPPEETAARAKANAKLVKRRRAQAKRVRGWSKRIAASVVAQSITVPTDAEAARERMRRGRAQQRGRA